MTNEQTQHQPVLIICMGVSGCGKSTLGAKIARQLKVTFVEADDFHPPVNRVRMAAGQPLTDAMREPWIQALCDHLRSLCDAGQSCVLAYSGLRKRHRQRFRELGFTTLFLFMYGSQKVIAKRLGSRKGHFMPQALLASQFAALESPLEEQDVVTVNIAQPISKVYAETRAAIAALGHFDVPV